MENPTASLQIVQTISTTFKKSQRLKSKKKTRDSRENFLNYLMKWIIDKSIFREILVDFWIKTEKYRKFAQFYNFESQR